MNEVIRIHPELSNMVVPILIMLEQRRLSASMKIQADRESDTSLTAINVNYTSMMNLLLRYAPLQLLGERRTTKRIALGRRVLSSCKHMKDASFLVEKAATDGLELKAVVSVDPRSALPHPQWKIEHDAVLIDSIVKYGWIDLEKSYRRIVNDKDILWGAPFQPDCEGTELKMCDEDWDDFCAAARRASAFVEESQELLEIRKNIDTNQIMEAYALKQFDNGTWCIDEELLTNGSQKLKGNGANKELADLPTKKELAKRARLVLSKSMLTIDGVGVASVGKSAGNGTNVPAPAVADHGFVVIDQGNRSYILLTEMVRLVCKSSHTKAAKSVNRLSSMIFNEVIALITQYESRGSSLDKQRASELRIILDQVYLARTSMKTSRTPGKNLLRAMIGLDPIQPKILTDPLYPSKSLLDQDSASTIVNAAVRYTARQAAPKKEVVQKKDEGTTGEKAILRSLKKAMDLRVDDVPNLFRPLDDAEVGLQLTMTEAFIIQVFCSEGIPLSKASAGSLRNSSKDWQQLFGTLKQLITDYLDELKDKHNSLVGKLDLESKEKSRVDLAKKIVTVEWEVTMATNSVKQITQMTPQGLAVKR